MKLLVAIIIFLFSLTSVSAESPRQFSEVLSGWENVKVHIENGDPMLIHNGNSPVEADWIDEFKIALFDLGGRHDYMDWLGQTFGYGGGPFLEVATAEALSKMTVDDISYWITYLSRYDRWNDTAGYSTVVIKEIENGRMEALIENLREKVPSDQLPHNSPS